MEKIDYYINESDKLGLMLQEKISNKRGTELSEVDKVSVRLFERLFGNYAGALVLYKNGLYVQVGSITRSIFEDYLNILYIQRTPEEERTKLAERYLDYARLVEPYKNYKNVKDLAKKMSDNSIVSKLYTDEKVKEINDNKENFENKYNRSLLSWSGLDFGSLADKAYEKDKYFKYYGFLSSVTHGSPLGNFTEEDISITIFLSLTSFVAIADLIGEDDLAMQVDKIKEQLLNETDFVL